MTTKLKFLWVLLALLVGGVGDLWAYTTVGYTEAISGSTLQARALSNGGLEHLTISSPIYGSNISDHAKTAKVVKDGGTTYTSTDSWRKSQNSSTYLDEQYVGYTLTVDEGYRLFISNVAAKLLVADDTYTWKVVVDNSEGEAVYTSTDKSASTSSTDALSENVTLSGLTGTVTVKLYMYQGGTTKYFSINYLTLGVTVAAGPTVYSSLPYTWDFANNSWESSKIQLENSSYWNVRSDNEARCNATWAPAANEIDMISGLAFSNLTADDGNNTYGSLCLDWTNKWVWLNGTVTLPALLRGHQVTIVSAAAPTDVSEGLTLMSTSGNTRVYRATTAIALPEFTFGGTSLYSIDVRNSVVQLAFRDDVSGYCRQANPTLTLPGGFTSYLFNYIPGISLNEYTVTTSPNGIFSIRANGGSNMESDSHGIKLVLTAASAGTSHVTVAINPTGEHAFTIADTYEFDVTVVKGTQTLSFADATKTINYNDAAPTNSLTQNPATGGGAVTYTSSDENVARVNSSTGELNIQNSGTCTITATAAETNNYNAATASYTLTVNGTDPIATIVWDTDHFPLQSSISYGGERRVRAVATAVQTGSGTVQYKSSNTSIATVTSSTYNIGGTDYDCCLVECVAPGIVTITAYVEGSGTYYPVEVTHQLTIIGAPLEGLGFLHESGKVKVGQTLTPYVKIPNVKVEDLTSVTVEVISGTDKIKVGAGQNTAEGAYGSSYTLTNENGGLTQLGNDVEGHDLQHLFPTILGVATGNATIRLSLNSNIYQTTTATYNVEVTDADLNFSWENPSQVYTLYTGDFMMMPAITGCANGNWDYSKGSNCETKQAYLYALKQGSEVWNYADFKVGEGYPNYRLTESSSDLTTEQKNSMTNATTKGYIVWAKSQNTSSDTLMIYGKTAGTVYLHAFDPQTKAELLNRIQINIVDKSSTLASQNATYASTMTFPYTWDFTKDITSLTNASPNYWEPHKNGNGVVDYYSCGYSTMFNWDYCDEDNDNNVNEAVANKYFVDANGLMPQFYAMTIFSGNSGDTNTKSYESKRDKLRYYPSRGDGQPHLSVVGGIHYLRITNPGGSMPDNFKLMIKAIPIGDKCTIYKFKNGDHRTDGKGTATWQEIEKDETNPTKPKYVSFDMSSSEFTGNNYVEIGVNNVNIYWIAMTTEAKTINPASGATGDNIEMMATYSYDKAIDYAKSSEANNVDAYVASALNWNTDDNTLQVTLKMNNAEVPTRTGVVLRTKNRASSKSFSFSDISNDKNINSQSGTDYRSAFSMDNDTIHVEANKFGWVKIEECSPSVTVGDHTYEKCLNLLGLSSKGYRYVRVAVTGPAVISVDCKADANASLEFYEGSYSGPNQGGTSVSVGTSATTVTYTHSGEKTYIYFCSATDTPIRIYGITRTNKGASAYMIADAQNEANYTAPSKPAANYLLSTWASDAAQPTLYRNAGNETGTVSGDTYLPFIFSSKYNRTATGNQDHDAGYFSFWRIWVNSITAGKNMAYIVLKKDDYVNAAKANGKAGDVTNWMSSGEGSRMTLRFIDNDEEDIQTTVESVVSEGVSDAISPVGDGYYYNLRGVRVEHPTKGLYILNGRKVWVK